jgi:hypothetical protein
LMDEFDPIRIARAYNRGGAAAVSVLTDSKFFQGSLADLEAARQEVKTPVLRKDFTLDEFHVIEAAAHGADAILLIVAILDPDALRRLREAAERYRMAVLVEVHDEAELKKAVDSGARIIGVNNRNLIDFSVSLATCERLAPMIPPGTIRVAESGIHLVGGYPAPPAVRLPGISGRRASDDLALSGKSAAGTLGAWHDREGLRRSPAKRMRSPQSTPERMHWALTSGKAVPVISTRRLRTSFPPCPC